MAIAARALAVWLILILAESIHGVLRTLLLAPRVGDFAARQIGVLTGSLLILGISWLFVRWIGATGSRQLLAVGALWLVLTLSFELGAGHWAFGRSWASLGQDYDLPHGGLLPLGLLFLTLSPLLAARIRS
ncbi:MAG: hypothetical protein ABI823_19460, partial [Bryobacteraceae bacterium]